MTAVAAEGALAARVATAATRAHPHGARLAQPESPECAQVWARRAKAPRSRPRSHWAGADPHSQLAELVATRGPLRRALAAVAGQLVRARSWERLGFARLRDYAVERAGHSARSLQDLARVDAALAGLPRVEAALVEGELTWTKARLLCRVASADDEALWVSFAREKTARALSREVRAVDAGALESAAAATDEDGALEEERETIQLRCTPAVRARWWRARQLARRVAGEALPVWGCMEAIAAEVLSALPLDQELEPAPHPARAEHASSGVWAEAAEQDPAASGCAVRRPRNQPEREGDRTRETDSQPMPPPAANGCAERRPVGEPERDASRGGHAQPATTPEENGCAEQRPRGEPERAAPQGPQSQPTPEPAASGCADQGRERGSPSPPERPSPNSPSASPAPQAPRVELPPFLASLVAGLENADAFDLDQRLRRAVALEQRLEAEMGPLVLRIAEGRLHRGAGFASMDEYARERLGISPRKARALLRLERAGRRARLLREAYRDGRLSWVQAHALVPVLAIAAAHQHSWIEWASLVTVRRLQEDVERALVLHATDPLRFEETAGLPADARGEDGEGDGREGHETREAPGGECESAGTEGRAGAEAAGDAEGGSSHERQTGAKTTRTGETCRIFWNGPRDVARLFRAVLCTVRRHIERRTGRLPSEGEALDAMLEHVFEAWTSGTGVEMGMGMGLGMESMGVLGGPGVLGPERVCAAHRVFARDGWRCTVPGCSSYRELHDHHIRFRSAGGSDAESNRTTLCAWHHLRGVHAGPARLRLRGGAPRHLRFELGLRQGRGAPALLRYDGYDRLSPAPLPRSSRGRRLS